MLMIKPLDEIVDKLGDTCLKQLNGKPDSNYCFLVFSNNVVIPSLKRYIVVSNIDNGFSFNENDSRLEFENKGSYFLREVLAHYGIVDVMAYYDFLPVFGLYAKSSERKAVMRVLSKDLIFVSPEVSDGEPFPNNKRIFASIYSLK